MNEFKVINVMNEAMIKLLSDKNEDNKDNLKIKDYLKDEALFFKINKSEAYRILLCVGVKQEQLENVYKKLINSDTFFYLLNKGKIKKYDKLVVKYDIYDIEDIFKSRGNISSTNNEGAKNE